MHARWRQFATIFLFLPCGLGAGAAQAQSYPTTPCATPISRRRWPIRTFEIGWQNSVAPTRRCRPKKHWPSFTMSERSGRRSWRKLVDQSSLSRQGPPLAARITVHRSGFGRWTPQFPFCGRARRFSWRSPQGRRADRAQLGSSWALCWARLPSQQFLCCRRSTHLRRTQHTTPSHLPAGKNGC